VNPIKTLLAEIRYRKLNFALSLVAVTIAVALFVAGPMVLDGYRAETQGELEELEGRVRESAGNVKASEAAAVAEMQRLEAAAAAEAAAQLARLDDETRQAMRDLGFNLMLVERSTDIEQFLKTREPTVDMPQEYVERLAKDKRLTMVTHLVATLRGRATWEGRDVPVVGYLPETPQAHMSHDTPMGFTVEPGTVFLGFRLWDGKPAQETVELGGKRFRVAERLAEQGSEEDGQIVMHLGDAQALLNKAEPTKRINLILALECRCPESALPMIRQQLAKVLPEVLVLRDNSKADARARQRKLVADKHKQIVAQQRQRIEEKHEKLIAQQKAVLGERQQTLDDTAEHRSKVQASMETLAGLVTPLVVLAAAVWVGLLALGNVRERRTEIGLLRALGKDSTTIATLFLGKALLVGFLGAAAGLLLGTFGVRWMGIGPLGISLADGGFRYDTLAYALLGAPLLSAVASYLPTVAALMQDPAVVLREQ
jgi:ABC-type lipoprotein release transport system permease subunit